MKLAFVAMLLALNFWYDFYHPGGFFIDGVILLVLFFWAVKSGKLF